jgi:hypothetical protein
MVCLIKLSNLIVYKDTNQLNPNSYILVWDESNNYIGDKIYELTINGYIISDFDSDSGIFTYPKSLINKCIKLTVYEDLSQNIKGRKLGCTSKKQCTEPKQICCVIVPFIYPIPWNTGSIEFKVNNDLCASCILATNTNYIFSWFVNPVVVPNSCNSTQSCRIEFTPPQPGNVIKINATIDNDNIAITNSQTQFSQTGQYTVIIYLLREGCDEFRYFPSVIPSQIFFIIPQ